MNHEWIIIGQIFKDLFMFSIIASLFFALAIWLGFSYILRRNPFRPGIANKEWEKKNDI